MGMEYFQFGDGFIRNMATGQQIGGPVDPPPPPVDAMKIGAFHDPINLTAWNQLEAQVGNMNIIRSYSSGLPNSWSAAGCTWHPADTTTWHSMKANWNAMASGSLDSTVISFLNSVPLNKDLWLTFAHEPENDGGVSSQWRAAQRHFYDVVKANRPETKVGPVFMDWTFNPLSGRNHNDWHVGPDYMDFVGCDPYNVYRLPIFGNPNTWEWPHEMVGLQNYWDFCDLMDRPPAIGEFGTCEHETQPTWKAQWMNEFIDEANDRGCAGVCWFNIVKANDTQPSLLLTSSQASIDTWSAIVDTYVGA